MPRNDSLVIRRVVTFVVAICALAACSSEPSVTTGTDPLPAASTVATTPPPIPSGRSCSNPSPSTQAEHGLEVRGVMRGDGDLWALFDGAATLRSGTPITTYWRISGNGALRITLVDASGRIERVTGVAPGVPPYEWAPPGEPWKSVITFPQPGCWRIYVQRGSLDGEVWVQAS